MGDSAGNLACHRAARSVWDKRGWSGVTIEERVGPWAVSITGAALIVAGVRRRSWNGAHLVIGGAMLIAGAAAGFCNPRHAAMRWRSLTACPPDALTGDLMDSFPASDPSSLTATAVGIVAIA
jgi:hypothetical protein